MTQPLRTRVPVALCLLILLLSSFSLAAQAPRSHPARAERLQLVTEALPQKEQIKVINFQQCANGASPSTNTGCDAWINGILNPNNSHYGEDQIVPQRAVFLVPAGGPATGRSLTFRYQSRKGGKHAYDSLGTWNYTQTTADRCQGLPSADCPSGSPSTFDIPDDPTAVNPASDGASNITSTHMLTGAARQLVMYGGTLTGMSAYTHSNALSSTGDDDTTVTIFYSVPDDGSGKVAADTKVMILYGGHTAVGLPVDPRGWGTNLGSSAVSGGPYHFKWIAADETSVGNRDNQIQGSALTCTDPSPTITADDSTCAMSGGNAASTQNIAGATYFWSVTNGTLDSGQGTNSITYTAGESGSVTIQVTVGVDGGCEGSDEVSVTIDPLTETEDIDPQQICEGEAEATFSVVASGSNLSYAWTFDGAPAGGNSADLTIDTSALAPGIYDVSVEVTGDCGTSTEETTLTVSEPATADAGADQTICEGDTVQLAGVYGGGASSGEWSTDGDGTFDDPSDPNAVYTPGAGDIAAGSVTLTFTTDDPEGDCEADSDSMVVTIDEPATADAGADQTICEGDTVQLAGVYGGSASSGEWSTDGDGTFDDPSDPNAVYTPGAGDIAAGSVTLTFTTDDPEGPCDADSDIMVVTIDEPATADAGADQTICAGETVQLAGSFGGGASSGEWSTDGDGTFDDPSKPDAVYTPGPNDIAAGSVTLTFTTDDPAGPCDEDSDTMVVTINPCDVFCSLTQGAYGNENGKFWYDHDGDPETLPVQYNRLQLIQALINGNPIVIGYDDPADLADRFFTIPFTGAECVILRLPAGGTPSALPELTSGSLIWESCQTTPPLPTVSAKKPEFANVLLGQTIALSLNVRLDPTLAAFNLCAEGCFETQGALRDGSEFVLNPGQDGVVGPVCTTDPISLVETCLNDDPIGTFCVSQAVLDELVAQGLPATVQGLLDLANLALGGQIDPALLSSINSAVDAINRGFDECRFFLGCTAPPQ